jgi:hypothetical protein
VAAIRVAAAEAEQQIIYQPTTAIEAKLSPKWIKAVTAGHYPEHLTNHLPLLQIIPLQSHHK